MKYLDFSQLEPRVTDSILASTIMPRPIALTISAGTDGRICVACSSLFNFFSGVPPVVCIGMRDTLPDFAQTLENLRETDTLVVNLLTPRLLREIRHPDSAAGRDAGVSIAGLETAPCVKTGLPRIASSPVALECSLWRSIDLGGGNHLAILRVLGAHVADPAVIDHEKCYIDGARLELAGRMQEPDWYASTKKRFHLRAPTFAEWTSSRTPHDGRGVNDTLHGKARTHG